MGAAPAETSGHATYWSTPGHLAELMAELEGLEADGLTPGHYHLPVLQRLHRRLAAGGTLSYCEVRLVHSVYITALADLYRGRIDREKQGLFWYAEGTGASGIGDQLSRLGSLGIKKGIAAAFEQARPDLPAYRDLRAALKTARAAFPGAWTELAGGPLLKEGDRDPRVARLRARLREGGYLGAAGPGTEEEFFSEEVTDALLAFQRLHGIRDDGILGPNTLRELNIQPAFRIDQLRANLERLRWYQRDREPEILLVDIAGAVVTYLDRGQIRLLSRAQAGRPARRTPTLKSRVTHVTVNPTWTVPPTILRNDILPAVREDIGYLARKNIRVLDYQGNELDPRNINWNDPGRIMLRQDAGPEAALGRAAIRFPNPFAVYLHDTPNRQLFDTSARFYSSGCVRVEQAVRLTEMFFEDASPERREEYHRAMASGTTTNVTLPERLPLLMFYWTAYANDAGVVNFRPDIYDRDRKLINLLGDDTHPR